MKREKKPAEALSRVARVLRLVEDKEDLKARKPAKATSVLVPKAPTPEEESEVEVIEVPLVRKRTLKKVVDVAALEAIPTVTVNVASFLANRRK